MAKLYETLSSERQLELAVRANRPAGLAQTFAAHAGQFYDRAGFDAIARRVSDLYARQSDESASCFRTRLDRRLYDHYHEPVAWDVAPAETRRAA